MFMRPNASISPRFLSGNLLKLVAAFTMLIDHMGVIFFPEHPIFRIIGRLSFPLYAFFIAEGCHYTKNRLRYFRQIFLLGVACQAVYFFASGDTHLNILLTLSCSILMIYALQTWKERKKFPYLLLFAAVVAGVYVLCQYIQLEYAFTGAMLPVWITLGDPPRGQEIGRRHHWLRVAFATVGLLLVSMDSATLQYYCLLVLPLLMLYSGKRGKGNYKYAFYLFYPLHLVALQVIAWLIP